MKFTLFKGKSRRTVLFTLITLSSIVLLLVGNIFLTYFTPIKSIYFDMTTENLYTLSDAMKKETAFVDELPGDKKIKITFCSDPDSLTESAVTRVTYFMALKLQDKYSNVEVETVNVNFNPTVLAPYKANSFSVINPTDVIVSYGDRYRISSATRFWQFSDGEYFSYDGEYHMVTMLKSVTAVEQPKAYFLVGHGETYYDALNPESPMSLSMESFKDLLDMTGLEIKTLDLSTVSEVPEDCVLLIINNPTEDLKTDPSQYGNLSYFSEADKIDKYLINKQGAVMVAKDYKTRLPVLEGFLKEWGIEFSDSFLKDTEASLDEEGKLLIAQYKNDENSYSNAIYGEFASMSSAPRMVFKNAGFVKCSYQEGFMLGEAGTMNTTRTYSDFVSTSASAEAFAKENHKVGNAGEYDLAALVIRDKLHEIDATDDMSYLFCTNTKDFFSNEIIGNSYYANYDVVSSLINNISRLDVHAANELGGGSLNSPTYGGKQIHNSYLSNETVNVYSSDAKEIIETNHAITNGMKAFITVVAVIFPLSLTVLGIVVKIKRKFL